MSFLWFGYLALGLTVDFRPARGPRWGHALASEVVGWKRQL